MGDIRWLSPKLLCWLWKKNNTSTFPSSLKHSSNLKHFLFVKQMKPMDFCFTMHPALSEHIGVARLPCQTQVLLVTSHCSAVDCILHWKQCSHLWHCTQAPLRVGVYICLATALYKHSHNISRSGGRLYGAALCD